MMGRSFERVTAVPAGSIVAVGGLERVVLKSATLCSSPYWCVWRAARHGRPWAAGSGELEEPAVVAAMGEEPQLLAAHHKLPSHLTCPVYCSNPFAPMVFQSSAIVRVSVEPRNPAHMPALEAGLRLIERADPFVEVHVLDTGELVLGAAGEVGNRMTTGGWAGQCTPAHLEDNWRSEDHSISFPRTSMRTLTNAQAWIPAPQVHLETCVKDLTERFARVELVVPPPLVGFRESILHRGEAEQTQQDIVTPLRCGSHMMVLSVQVSCQIEMGLRRLSWLQTASKRALRRLDAELR